jgi:hypothetical protein
VLKVSPNLAGVSETMLWSLHSRASEARLPDALLVDPESLRIQSAIDYDFARHFGTPAGSLAVRAARIDQALREWLARHPDGIVVSLGEGLETQSRRVDNQRMRWVSVDLPDAIRLREQFLPASDRFRHIAVSALDPAWMAAIDPSAPVFIIAQGLLMYLPPDRVRFLLCAIAARFPGGELVFDSIPRWFSQLTLLGLRQTPHYRLPPMPWGINRDELAPTLRAWHPGLADVTLLDYGMPRGLPRVLGGMIDRTLLRHEVPSLAHVAIALKPKRASRRRPMPSDTPTHPEPETMQSVLAAASRTANNSGELALTSAQVIAKRVALGVAASVNPLQADHTEFARMVPEKMAALSAAGKILLQWSDLARQEAARSACAEVQATADAARAMVGSMNPLAIAMAQGNYTRALVGRIAAQSCAAGMFMLAAQDAAMAPFRDTVANNLERLA